MEKKDREIFEADIAELVLELGMFSLLTASIALLWRDNLILSIVVLAECLLTLGLWHNKSDLAFFFIVALLGSVSEIVFVHYGVWQYANPSVFGVPFWFPLAFGTSGLTCIRLVHTITLWDKVNSVHVSKK
ncbi:MAG TPA: hypothetical protein VIH48_01405 [Candidatus Bathyarchaeia archaeon]